MTGTVRVHSHAKLNLTLNITGVRDGYHLIDSFVAGLNVSDEIVLRPRRDGKINVVMHGMDSEGIPPEKNSALRAGELFVQKYGTKGADVTVFKNIPMGAGLGGSSADAAGVLRGMSALYGIEDAAGVKALADRTGSDTGYMLGGGFARMTGRGENVEPFESNARLWFLLLCPRAAVSTAACYREYDNAPDGARTDTADCLRAFAANDFSAMGKCFYNALYAPACRLEPAVQRAAAAAAAFSPLGWGMTGSGSAVFALFETRELCEWAQSRYRGDCRATVVCTVSPAAAERTRKKKSKIWRNPFFLTDEETGKE